MPRSVNSVASRARRKKILKQAKGYFGRRKNAWNELSHSFKDHQDVSTVIAFGDLQKLKKNKSSRQFYIEPFIKDSISNKSQLNLLKEEIFNKSPFYDKFLINSESKAIRTAINLKTA